MYLCLIITIDRERFTLLVTVNTFCVYVFFAAIDQFHVLRYCFLNNVICNADLMIAHKHVFVFNNYDRS